MPLAIINRGLSGRGVNVTAAALPCHGGVSAPAVKAPVGALATGKSGLPACSKRVNPAPPLDSDFLTWPGDIPINIGAEGSFGVSATLTITEVTGSSKQAGIVGPGVGSDELKVVRSSARSTRNDVGLIEQVFVEVIVDCQVCGEISGCRRLRSVRVSTRVVNFYRVAEKIPVGVIVEGICPGVAGVHEDSSVGLHAITQSVTVTVGIPWVGFVGDFIAIAGTIIVSVSVGWI